MKSFPIIALILISSLVSAQDSPVAVPIDWTKHLAGDYSFAKKKTIECDAWCYEWAGTSGMVVKRLSKDTVLCYTLTNEATHCSLVLKITDSLCIPTIELISVARGGNKVYLCEAGTISIDESLWKKKILKADFSFHFKNDENSKVIYWKGKICAKIR